MNKYKFNAEYISPEVITFNPSFIKKNTIELVLESNRLFVRRLEREKHLMLIDLEWISRVNVNKKKDLITFKISTGEFRGKYIIYNFSHQNGIKELVNLLIKV